jgi:hypothetical protein
VESTAGAAHVGNALGREASILNAKEQPCLDLLRRFKMDSPRGGC